MSVIGNIKSVSSGVTDLTKQINQLTTAIKTLKTESNAALTSAKGVIGSGGQLNLGVGGSGNLMSNSFGQITTNAGPIQTAGMGTLATVARMGLAVGAAGYSAMPSAGDTLSRAAGYYQSALYGGAGTSRAALQNATLKALGGGLSYPGADAAVSAILTRSIGMAPASFGYLQATADVGGAARYLGMNNAVAAQAIGGQYTGAMGANLYQYGVNTIDPRTGKQLSTGQIARQLYNRMFVNGATKEQVQTSLQQGFAGANLRNMGLSDAQQQIYGQAFIDIASGQNPDLASKTTNSAGAGNVNPLTGQMSINQSTTQLMQDAESGVISGFNQAAKVVNAANKELDKFATSLGYLRGLIGGIGGSNVGTGAAAGAGVLASGITQGVGMALGSKAIKSVGGSVVGQAVKKGGASLMARLLPFLGRAALTGVEALAVVGGGEVGYGGSFGSSTSGASGAQPPVQGPVSAGYNAKGGELWKSTQGIHKGLDYAIPMNSPVKASMDGTVSNMPLSSEYGTVIVVNGTDGLQYIYGHLSQSLVRAGQNVKAGQVIGRSGKSGNCSGPCLHFEVRKGANNPIDPNIVLGNSTATNTSGGPGSYSISNNYPGVTGPIKASGTVTSWAKTLLGKLGAPTTKDNISALSTWAAHEGGNWHNTAYYNPLNTTLNMPGSTSINSVGVKAYKDWNQGYQATVNTLLNTKGVGYEKIVSDLRSGKSTFSQTFADISNSGWVSGHTGRHSYGGGEVGYGASMPATTSATMSVAPATTTSSTPATSKVVNINITGNPDPLLLAKKVKAYLDNDTAISMIGNS